MEDRRTLTLRESGIEGIKEASIQLEDRTVKIAVVNGLRCAETLLERIKAGEVQYDFEEVMACKRGCIAGGGQPVPIGPRTKQARLDGMYKIDSMAQIKRSDENPIIAEVYEGILKGKGHKLLHKYTKKSPYIRCTATGIGRFLNYVGLSVIKVIFYKKRLEIQGYFNTSFSTSVTFFTGTISSLFLTSSATSSRSCSSVSRNQNLCDSCTLGGHKLFRKSADRHDTATQGNFSGHGIFRADFFPGEK